jgi:hypothetical protein
MALSAGWAAGAYFDSAYCDAIGDRLVEASSVGFTRTRGEIVLAWPRARRVAQPLACNAPGRRDAGCRDNGLVDRLFIEMRLTRCLAQKLRAIETVTGWRRESWHPKIGEHLDQLDVSRRNTELAEEPADLGATTDG